MVTHTHKCTLHQNAPKFHSADVSPKQYSKSV